MAAIFLVCGAGGPQLKRNPLGCCTRMHEYMFRWAPSEYVRAVRAISRNMAGRHRLTVLVWLGVGLSVALLAFRPLVQPGILPALLWLVLLVLLIYAGWVAPWLTARTVQREDPCANDELRHIVSEDGFGVRSRTVSLDVSWDHIVKVVETDEFFLFFYTKRVAYFTPKRVIPVADLPLLRASLRKYLGAKAHLATDSKAAA